MPKPTITEQIEAVALLREFAKNTPNYVNPTVGDLAVVDAIHVLDNADLFADLDQLFADLGQERDAAKAATVDPGAPNGRGKCSHCGHPRVPLTPQGLTMYHGDVKSGKGDCIGSLSTPEQPLDAAEITQEDRTP